MLRPIITRYFDKPSLERVKKELPFLIAAVNRSGAELDFQIRGLQEFNLYYRGNSLVQVKVPEAGDSYTIRTNKKFLSEVDEVGQLKNEALLNSLAKLSIKNWPKRDDWWFEVSAKNMHPFLQSIHIKKMQSRISAVNYQEEKIVQQNIVTDNSHSEDIVIVDMEVSDRAGTGRADFLALKRTGAGVYRFLLIELKLGKNQELDLDEGKNVLSQIKRYIDKISIPANFTQYHDCYVENIRQKRALGLDSVQHLPANLRIAPECLGLIVVAHYSGLAADHLLRLAETLRGSANIKLQQIRYDLQFV